MQGTATAALMPEPVMRESSVSSVRVLVAVLVAIAVTCCEKRDIPAPTLGALQAAEQYELLSLDPSPLNVPPENFHNWRILGRTSVSNAATRKKLNDALRSGVQSSDGLFAACFVPRHGIRVTRAGKVTDVVICFDCLQAMVFSDGKETQGFLTAASPQDAFDSVLRDAGVPLAEKPE